MAELRDILAQVQTEVDEKELLPIRSKFWIHIIIGIIITVLFIVVANYIYPQELSRIGGGLVGIAVITDIIAHWFQLNPIKKSSKERALSLIVISGTIAVFGTFLWTFGDLI